MIIHYADILSNLSFPSPIKHQLQHVLHRESHIRTLAVYSFLVAKSIFSQNMFSRIITIVLVSILKRVSEKVVGYLVLRYTPTTTPLERKEFMELTNECSFCCQHRMYPFLRRRIRLGGTFLSDRKIL